MTIDELYKYHAELQEIRNKQNSLTSYFKIIVSNTNKNYPDYNIPCGVEAKCKKLILEHFEVRANQLKQLIKDAEEALKPVWFVKE